MLCALMMFAGLLCANAQQQPVVINGIWHDAPDREVGVYSIENGELKQLSRSAFAADGSFALAFHPQKEGFYALAIHPQRATYRHVFYFKPGDNLQLELKRDSYQLTGKLNTAENKEMEKWHNAILPLESKADYTFFTKSTFKDFFAQLEELLPQLKSYPAVKTKNKLFNRTFERYRYYNWNDVALSYIFTPKSVHPTPADYPAYYRSVDLRQLTSSADLLGYPGGLSMISKADYIGLYLNPDINDANRSEHTKRQANDYSRIANDTIRGEYILQRAATITTYPGIMSFKAANHQYLATDDQRQRFEAIVKKHTPNPEGTEPYMFSFTDIDGRQVALSDFKGKVVYIDCWATWCAPCKQEIPFMGKLEEEYAGKDIVFVSISLDKEKDKAKWQAMVREKNMKGYQLFAGNDGHREIGKHYTITGIPRFILIGRDGKVIYSKAPRPSSDEIRAVLDEALR